MERLWIKINKSSKLLKSNKINRRKIILEWIVFVKSKKVERRVNNGQLMLASNVLQRLEVVKSSLIVLHHKSNRMKKSKNVLNNFEEQVILLSNIFIKYIWNLKRIIKLNLITIRENLSTKIDIHLINQSPSSLSRCHKSPGRAV